MPTFGEDLWRQLEIHERFQHQMSNADFVVGLKPFVLEIGTPQGVLNLDQQIVTLDHLIDTKITFLENIEKSLKAKGAWTDIMRQTIGSWLAMAKLISNLTELGREPLILGVLKDIVHPEFESGKLTVRRLLELQPTWILT